MSVHCYGLSCLPAVLVCLLLGGLSEASAAVISVGTPIPVAPNTIAVPIEITDAVDLFFWQFDVAYDPTDLQINTGCDPFGSDIYCGLLTGPITEGEFFGSLSPFNTFNPGFVTVDPSTLQQTGLLLAVNDTFGGSLPGPSGSGVLAYVEFLVIGSGNSPITVEHPVTRSAPEPTTLALLLVSSAGLGARRFTHHTRRAQ